MARMQPLATLCLLAVVPTAQSVWTVDDDQPANFTDLQPAYDAASSGDVILVRPGTYSALFMNAHGVTLVAEPPGAALVAGNLVITGVSDDTVVAGLRTVPGPGELAPGSVVVGSSSSTSHVWIEDVRPADGEALPTFFMTGGAETTLVRCSNFASTLTPAQAASATEDGSCTSIAGGLTVNGGKCTLLDCDLVGFDGVDGVAQAPGVPFPGPPGCGGSAVVVWPVFLPQADLTVIGSRLTGGRGGRASLISTSVPAGCYAGAPGGAAIRFHAGTAPVRVQDSLLVPGLGGEAFQGCLAGPVGVPVDGGTVNPLSGLYRQLVVATPPGATAAQVAFDARVAGAACFYGVGVEAVSILLPGLEGLLLTSPLGPVHYAGLADAMGSLAISVPLGTAAGSGRTFYAQAGYVLPLAGSGGTKAALGGADTFTLLP